MDFNDTTEAAKFRSKARNWLSECAPDFEITPEAEANEAELINLARSWQKKCFDGGFAGITLETQFGGQGGSAVEDNVYIEEEARFRLPRGPYINIGLNMAIPVVAKHGNEAQIERFLRKTLMGELTWCQLFSEPAAGSDLAALRTRAERKGNNWIVNGQKVWTSWAAHADWGLLIARTDPRVAKHKGLTFFVLDMKTHGVEVRPIRQISGASDFNEVFLTDVEIPDECRIGEVNGGWGCAMTVLTGERLSENNTDPEIARLIRILTETNALSGAGENDLPGRLALAQHYADERATSLLQARLRTRIGRGENIGALGGLIKLAYANRLQKSAGLAMELAGLGGIAIDSSNQERSRIWDDYIWSSALRIAGGADEVLRNQIAERVLGLPREHRIDKDKPFNEL